MLVTSAGTDFFVAPFRFHFRAEDEIYFPDEKATNILRGAFGLLFRKLVCAPECGDSHVADCRYARIFAPKQNATLLGGPSGLADPPRSYVFRGLHLNGVRIAPGEPFYFDLILFEPPEKTLEYFVLTFREIVREGLGPGRGRAALVKVESLANSATFYDGQTFTESALKKIVFDVAMPEPYSSATLHLTFVTPTELKAERVTVTSPEFWILFARLRDRLSNLRACYQGGPLAVDFSELGEVAKGIRMLSSDLHRVETERRSSRTGQRHSIGGFVGDVEYEGDFQEFIPFLNLGQWTGVGRQTSWGKGTFVMRDPAR